MSGSSTTRWMHRLWLAVVVVAISPLCLATLPAYGQDFAIGKPAFQRVWSEQDGPVADDAANRSWTWGPAPISPVLQEPLRESPGGMREVQYFDKSRMEINDPNADPTNQWYVTNGLLPIEMMTGRIQVGYEAFTEAAPARISAIGDPDTYPTYADLAPLTESPGALDRAELGQPVTRLLRPDGTVGSLDSFSADPATVLVEGSNGHGIPRGFFEFQNSQGLIYLNGQPTTGQVYFPKFVFGLPITAPYWVNSRVGGQDMPILFQVFERRVLTYNPANPPGFRIEMGNVGQHYLRWRYDDNPPAPEPTTEPYPAPPTNTPEPTATPTPEPYPAPPTDTPEPTTTPTPEPTTEPYPAPPTNTPEPTPVADETATPTEDPGFQYQPGTCLTPREAELARLINEYRGEYSLPAVPVSTSLSHVAQAHVVDLHEHHPDTGTDSRGMECNLHSWSDQGNWTPVCYTSDHAYAEHMWNKPGQITNNVYTGNGYEIASMGGSEAGDPLAMWKNSPGHNNVIIEGDGWGEWNAMGVGYYHSYAVVWFGYDPDPQGTMPVCE